MQGKTILDKAGQQMSGITVRDLDEVNILRVSSCEEMLRVLQTYGKSVKFEPAIALPEQSKLICFGQL